MIFNLIFPSCVLSWNTPALFGARCRCTSMRSQTRRHTELLDVEKFFQPVCVLFFYFSCFDLRSTSRHRFTHGGDRESFPSSFQMKRESVLSLSEKKPLSSSQRSKEGDRKKRWNRKKREKLNRFEKISLKQTVFGKLLKKWTLKNFCFYYDCAYYTRLFFRPINLKTIKYRTRYRIVHWLEVLDS